MDSSQKYFQYFTFGLGGIIDRILYQKRREIFDCFMREMSPTEKDTVLDIGVSDEDHPSSNLFEKLYPYTSRITAVGIHNFKHLKEVYPGLTFVRADGRSLPFDDNSFDYVYSHAVLEHTGSRASQLAFIAEAFRVATKGVFITTPNRSHPVEFHTAIPLLHYLPHKFYRKIYSLLGKKFYAREENLNLLSAKELLSLGYRIQSKGVKIKLRDTKFLLFSANLILIVKKQ
jgi:hypothetical protein